MAKFHSKIGDVFEIAGMEPARYLQLVHIDPVQMNSDVVVVYQEGADEFDFYTHTTVEQGLQDQLWRKVDKEPLAVDLAKLTFKQFMEDVFDEGIEPYWYYWTCEDAEWKEVGLQEGIGLRAVDGSIHPASDILYQIAHGKSEFKVDWPGN